MDHLAILPKSPQNVFYTQSELKQSPHLKRTPFKEPKWKFSSLIDQSVIVTNFAQNLRCTQNEQATTFQISKMETYKSNGHWCFC